MDGLQGAILRVKLRILAEGNAARRAHAARYDARLLGDKNVITPFRASYAVHVYHLYVIRVKERDRVMQLLSQKGVNTGIHYPKPVHLQVAYSQLGYGRGSFPVTELCAEEIISLPMFPELAEDQVNRVADSLKEVLSTG